MEKKKFFWQRKKTITNSPGSANSGRHLGVVWTTVKVALGAGLVALTVVLLTGGIFACLLGNYLQEDVIPNADFNVEDFALDRSSFIYFLDSQNNIQKMQQIYADIDRVWVSYEDIPKDLIHAAVAIEDKRFFQHQGVDWLTTTKACINMFLGGGSTFGGSTITQQLIKNLTTEDDVTVRRKVLEIFRASSSRIATPRKRSWSGTSTPSTWARVAPVSRALPGPTSARMCPTSPRPASSASPTTPPCMTPTSAWSGTGSASSLCCLRCRSRAICPRRSTRRRWTRI